MRWDVQNLLSGTVSAAGVLAGQTVTGTDTSVISTNTIDLQQARDLGNTDAHVTAIVTTAYVGGTSVEFQLISATAENLTTNQIILARSPAYTIAQLVAGFVWNAEWQRHWLTTLPLGQRYVGLRYVTVGAVSAGAIFAGVTLGTQERGNRHYPDGATIV